MMNAYQKLTILIISFSFITINSHDTSVIAPGIEYEHVVFHDADPQSIHILTVDPQQAHISVGLAHEKCASAETVSHMAQRTGATAAVNGGFWGFGNNSKLRDAVTVFFDYLGYSFYNAHPCYGLKVDGAWVSLSRILTGAIGWKDGGKQVVCGTIKTTAELTIDETTYPIKNLNPPYAVSSTLYTAAYDERTPQYETCMTEIIIENDKIQNIAEHSYGNTRIPDNGCVFVINESLTNSIEHGDTVRITFVHESEEEEEMPWDAMDHIVASTPLMLRDGEIVPRILERTSTFYTKRHPRSAVGITEDGLWIFVVVDGRKKGCSGFTMIELAECMKNLGCQYACNLDGGGSSTMVVDNAVVNSPSGRTYSLVKKERPVSNAILISTPT